MTAHWMAKIRMTTAMQLKMTLIAFHHIDGKHDDEKIARIVMNLLDRAEMTLKVRVNEAVITMHISNVLLKVRHFTMDNAANKGTMMQALVRLLEKRDIDFDPVNCKIMCFTHIINLTCEQVMQNIDKMAHGNGDDQSDDGSIMWAHNIVRAIQGLGKRRDEFNKVTTNGNCHGWFKEIVKGKLVVVKVKEWQLLWDMCTWWDSTYHMLDRLHEMHPVWLYFCWFWYVLNNQFNRLLITFSLFLKTVTLQSTNFRVKTEF